MSEKIYVPCFPAWVGRDGGMYIASLLYTFATLNCSAAGARRFADDRGVSSANVNLDSESYHLDTECDPYDRFDQLLS